jgi:aryl-alcohol dehydrogenase-like predicted oxidoreductase
MRTATRALDAGYCYLDCAERYRNEADIGDVLQAYYAASGLSGQNIFITTKLWNTNHRPERVEAAFEGSLEWLKLDVLDLYLIHTSFAFEPGDNFDPRSESGDIVYDRGVTLQETWGAMEDLVRRGRTRAIGISDVGLEEVGPFCEEARHQTRSHTSRGPPVSAANRASHLLPRAGNGGLSFRASWPRHSARPHRRFGGFVGRQAGSCGLPRSVASLGSSARDRDADHA